MVHLHESSLRGIQTRQGTSEVLSWAGLSCAIWDGLSGKQKTFWEGNASNAAFFPNAFPFIGRNKRFSDLINPFDPLVELWKTGYLTYSYFDQSDFIARLYMIL